MQTDRASIPRLIVLTAACVGVLALVFYFGSGDNTHLRGQLVDSSTTFNLDGPPATFPTAPNNGQPFVVPVSATQAITLAVEPGIVVPGFELSTNKIAARLATVDGSDNITLGSPVSFNPADSYGSTIMYIRNVLGIVGPFNQNSAVVLYETNEFCAVYCGNGTERIQAVAVTFTGDSLVWGTPYTVIDSENATPHHMQATLDLSGRIEKLSNNKFAVSWKSNTGAPSFSDYAVIKEITIDGGTISSGASPISISGISNIYYIARLEDYKVALFVNNGTNDIPVYVWESPAGTPTLKHTIINPHGFTVTGIGDGKYLLLHNSSNDSGQNYVQARIGSYNSDTGILTEGADANVGQIGVNYAFIPVIFSSSDIGIVTTVAGVGTWTLNTVAGAVSESTIQFPHAQLASNLQSTGGSVITAYRGAPLTSTKAIVVYNENGYNGVRRLVVSHLVNSSSSSSSSSLTTITISIPGSNPPPVGACCLPKKYSPGLPAPVTSMYACYAKDSQFTNAGCLPIGSCSSPVGTVTNAAQCVGAGGKWFTQVGECSALINADKTCEGQGIITIQVPFMPTGSSSSSQSSSSSSTPGTITVYFPVTPSNSSSSSASSSSSSSQPLIEIEVINTKPTLFYTAFGTISRVANKIVDVLVVGNNPPPEQQPAVPGQNNPNNPPQQVPAGQLPGQHPSDGPSILPTEILPTTNIPIPPKKNAYFVTGAPASPEGKRLFLSVMFDWLKKFLSPTSN